MMNFDVVTVRIVYLIFCAIVIWLLHIRFARKWRKYEYARWGLGVGTITLGAFTISFLGALDFETVAIVAVAFGVSAVVKFFAHVSDSANRDEAISQQMRLEARSNAEKIIESGS